MRQLDKAPATAVLPASSRAPLAIFAFINLSVFHCLVCHTYKNSAFSLSHSTNLAQAVVLRSSVDAREPRLC